MSKPFTAGPSRANRATMSDSVALDIEQRILEGDLEPGQRLPTELELGEALAVSRSVVRDAMRTLSARGLVQVRQGIGMVVSSPSDAALSDALVVLLMRSELTMGDVIEARAAIEAQCAGLASRRGTAEDFDSMQASLEAFAASAAAADWEAVREHHFAFHRKIVEAVHMPALELLLRPMQRVILITGLPTEGNDAAAWEYERHPPILEALRHGDEQQARRQMHEHFSGIDSQSRDYEKLRHTPFKSAAKLEEWLGLRSSRAPEPVVSID